jgi:hypothetical protein
VLALQREVGVRVPFQAILHEVDQLQNVSTRLEQLAEQHPAVSAALLTIAGSVRNTATILAVLVATKIPDPI